MCLEISKKAVQKVAEADICCYKIVRKTDNLFYRTLFRNAEVQLGSTYKSMLSRSPSYIYDKIEMGLHTFIEFESALGLIDTNINYFNTGDAVIIECVIPKGCCYYEGVYDSGLVNYKSYASDTLEYVKEVYTQKN